MKHINKKTHILASDFDGTITTKQGVIPQSIIDGLQNIQNSNILRVIATGRSLFSFLTIVDKNFPIDYLIFSGGVGVMDWKTKNIIAENHFSKSQTLEIYNTLKSNNFDFMVQYPVPYNHIFYQSSSGNYNSDFEARINYYKTNGITPAKTIPKLASQFVIICNEGTDHFQFVKENFGNFKVTKATSPIDHKSLWIEIFPKHVSKAYGLELLRIKHDIPLENIVAVGNDYYDYDMLEYVKFQNAYVVANAPYELLQRYNIIPSSENEGLANLLNSMNFYR
ncbi:MAG: HAD family hydrolase [Bacteroidales bacterium]|nr:HAD family hydrolase [Bacteroidales bacterium]